MGNERKYFRMTGKLFTNYTADWRTCAICKGLFFAILRAHHEITAQVNSIGGQSDTLAPIPYSTFKSIRFGRNVLIMCLAFLILTFPFAIFCFMSTFHVDNYLPSSYKFVATWIFVCNSSVNSLIYVGLLKSVRDKTGTNVACWCLQTMYDSVILTGTQRNASQLLVATV